MVGLGDAAPELAVPTIGRTAWVFAEMGDVLSQILRRYGSLAISVAFLLALVVCVVTHLVATPGTEVSVLWGLIRYTKAPAAVAHISSVVNRAHGQADAEPATTRTRAATPTPESTNPSPEPTTPAGLLAKGGGLDVKPDTVLRSLREFRKLRELTAVESGKRVQEVPVGTYFFVPTSYLSTSPFCPTFSQAVLQAPAQRYRAGNSDFEIHNTEGDGLQLIGFLDEIQAAILAKPADKAAHEILVSPASWAQMKCVVSIRISRMRESVDQRMEVSPGENLYAIRITVQ